MKERSDGSGIRLDHLAHFVANLDQTADALAGIGFIPTPVAVQQNRTEHGMVPAGMANRCVMLRHGYLEFLTAVSQSALASQFHEAVARYTGVHLVAMAVDRPEDAFDVLQKNGFAPDPPINLTRPAPGPEKGGDSAPGPEARFSVVRVPPGTMPEGRIQILTHHTPELIWRERFMAHPNAVEQLEAVLMIVEDAQETAARYGRFLNRDPESLGSGRSVVRLDRGALAFAEPSALARTAPYLGPFESLPRIAAYCVGSADPDTTDQAFRAGGLDAVSVSNAETAYHLPPVLGGVMTVCPLDASPTWMQPDARR